MPLLPSDRYEDIRLKLDPTLDGEEAIPNEVLTSDMVLGEAERWILKVDPTAASRVGGELQAVYRAIICYAAAVLSPSVPQAKQVNMAGHSVTTDYAETPSERTARLYAEATAAVAYYLPAILQTTVTTMTYFTTVSGRRA